MKVAPPGAHNPPTKAVAPGTESSLAKSDAPVPAALAAEIGVSDSEPVSLNVTRPGMENPPGKAGAPGVESAPRGNVKIRTPDEPAGTIREAVIDSAADRVPVETEGAARTGMPKTGASGGDETESAAHAPRERGAAVTVNESSESVGGTQAGKKAVTVLPDSRSPERGTTLMAAHAVNRGDRSVRLERIGRIPVPPERIEAVTSSAPSGDSPAPAHAAEHETPSAGPTERAENAAADGVNRRPIRFHSDDPVRTDVDPSPERTDGNPEAGEKAVRFHAHSRGFAATGVEHETGADITAEAAVKFPAGETVRAESGIEGTTRQASGDTMKPTPPINLGGDGMGKGNAQFDDSPADHRGMGGGSTPSSTVDSNPNERPQMFAAAPETFDTESAETGAMKDGGEIAPQGRIDRRTSRVDRVRGRESKVEPDGLPASARENRPSIVTQDRTGSEIDQNGSLIFAMTDGGEAPGRVAVEMKGDGIQGKNEAAAGISQHIENRAAPTVQNGLPVPGAGSHAEMYDEMMGTIVRYARLMTSRGQSSAVIKLEPPSLGRLKLEIVTERSKVTGKITVESREVRKVIEHRLAELRENLAQNGLKVESFDVQVGHNDGTDGWARREHFEGFRAPLSHADVGERAESASHETIGEPRRRPGPMMYAGSFDVVA